MGPTKTEGGVNLPNGDVFAEMKACLDRGMSGRPALARFVEVTYEAMLSLKAQLERVEIRLSKFEQPSRRGPNRPRRR